MKFKGDLFQKRKMERNDDMRDADQRCGPGYSFHIAQSIIIEANLRRYAFPERFPACFFASFLVRTSESILATPLECFFLSIPVKKATYSDLVVWNWIEDC